MKKVLVAVAHADDEILGAGGTIARFSKDHEVYVLIVTDSCSSQYRGQDVEKIIEEKKKCAVKANNLVGVKKVIYSDLPDMALRETPHTKINAVIEKAIDEIKPQIILTHHFGDVNLDHQEVYKSVMVAARPTQYTSVEKIYTFEVLSATEWQSSDTRYAFIPNTYIDISDSIEKKIDALMEYSQEIREYPHPRSAEAIRNLAKFRGQSVGMKYAEALCLVRDVKRKECL